MCITTESTNLERTILPPLFYTAESFEHVVTHVFFPVELPMWDDCTVENDLSLASAVCSVARAYTPRIPGTSEEGRWYGITKMLDDLRASVQSERLEKDHIITQLRGMETRDIIMFAVRPRNTAIVLTRRDDSTLLELLEVSPAEDAVRKTSGSLICSYPLWAVETPNEVFDDECFQSEFASFLSLPSATSLDPPRPPYACQEYVTTLLNGILRGVSRTADVTAIPKRIRDNVGQWPHDPAKFSAQGNWRRSALWLLIRVAIQISVERSSAGRALYKQFVLCFMCTVARDGHSANLSNDLLHLMSSKIVRRLRKLGLPASDWLSGMALETCTRLREILDTRWKELSVRPSPFCNPSQEELVRDTELSLLNSREYIRNVISIPDTAGPLTPFYPNHRRRGTLKDFLSLDGSFFDEAYRADSEVTIYDVELLVEQEIDDWVAHVALVDDGCARLDILMDQYSNKFEMKNPEHDSIKILTMLELFIALDKLGVREIPMLADYSPSIPIAWLEKLFLRKKASLHRLSCAYQYLVAREAQSRLGWSIQSNEFTQESFPIRYYDKSPHLQQLRSRIEQETTEKVDVDGGQEVQYTHSNATGTQDAALYRSPLPASLSHAKVVVFELQCPPCFSIWRSAIARIYHYIGSEPCDIERMKCRPLADVPELQPYFVKHRGPPPFVQVCFAYLYPDGSQSWNTQILCYLVHHKGFGTDRLWAWQRPRDLSIGNDFMDGFLRQYADSTHHTSNDILAEQTDCPRDFFLDEFITFGHLRSGASLQWLNILRGLRSRTINLRREQVHHLISRATFQVGLLDMNTAAWKWHQELQDASFCDILIDELDNLFVDGVGLISWEFMSTISLLLSRILASSPSIRISERAIAVLRSVHRKTFSWVQELSYDLQMAPMNEECKNSLLRMALACRGIFDVDRSTHHQLIHSPEDVDTLLSCSLIIHALHPSQIRDMYLKLLLEQDNRLTPALEGAVMDANLADPSNRGVDLAIARIFTSYLPNAHRLVPLQYPNSRWLTCKTNAIQSRPSQMVHINLLDGQLRVNGQLFGRLPREIRDHRYYKGIFGYNECFVVPSDLPGMDLMTLTMTPNYKVHFSLRDKDLVVRASCNQTNRVLELIPPEVLRGDLPSALVDGHIHWLDTSSEIIEIRPHQRCWEQCVENWRVDCTSRSYRASKGRELLVDIQSTTWAMLSECFDCLAAEETCWGLRNMRRTTNILITTSFVDSVRSTSRLQLAVTLPRYDLSFFVNDREELESRDFKGMVFDEDQCIQTLFGLKSLMVLRPTSYHAGLSIPQELISRVALVPDGHPNSEGEIGFSKCGSYHKFKVDPELGCLTGNGDSKSTRLLAYLHAMTNSHQPDPLTDKIGTQAALDFLLSAGCRSIMQLRALTHDKPLSSSLSPWSSTKYPQLNAAHDEIQNLYYWNHHTRSSGGGADLPEKRAAQRAVHLFPQHCSQLMCPEVDNDCQWDYSVPNSNVSDKLGIPPLPSRIPPSQHMLDPHTSSRVMLERLLSNRPPPTLPRCSTLTGDAFRATSKTPETSNEVPALDRLFSSLQANSIFQHEYLALLGTSASACKQYLPTIRTTDFGDSIGTLEKYYTKCRTSYMDALCRLKETLGPATDIERALNHFGQWPPITADVLLRCLAPTSRTHLANQWKQCLVSFAQLLLEVQRARRLLRFALDDPEELSNELENEQCNGWNAEEYPDWLLIQVQGDFLIRRAQAETAMQLMFPQSGGNTVMQVNMGEGKTSVIIPIVAAALADGKQLVRVIVPKALIPQMFDILVARLGWLVNRPVYHLPFSRTAYNDPKRKLPVETLHRLMLQCIAERGVLLVQPEHAVSLKLMCVEKQIRGGSYIAKPFSNFPKSIYQRVISASSSLASRFLWAPSKDSLMGSIFRRLVPSQNSSKASESVDSASDKATEWLALHIWVHSHVRDILDESDEILHPRFQLIYTIGLEQHMDGYPDRWTISQRILRLVREHAHTLSRNHPTSVEYEHGQPGSFPRIRIVRASDVGRRLISMVIEDVMAGRLANFNFQQISCAALRDAIRSFISDQDVLQVSETANVVEEYAKRSHQSYLWNGLLLLRGLLSSNILLFALSERRWRVDYGLDRHHKASTMLAVPYRAKDVTAPNTQFSHPDLTIILTCLSYYYTGLTERQLRATFEILLDQDDPITEYSHWIQDCESLPDSLQKLSDINPRSSEQWDNVTFPLFAWNQGAIDFYLSRVVFPREAKEYPWRLCGSSWDLGEKRERLVTGFSGTSDGRWLLPMSVVQHDLDHQRGTSAGVFARLLRQEQGNDSENYVVTHENGERQATGEFLKLLATRRPEIRVLLDVGAQILDLSNHQVAKAWLWIVGDAEAAVYFDENDETRVLTRNGRTHSLSSSPFSQKLGQCIVYLDHTHTRGTDLKLPIGSRAAITLGPRLTKDALVQGCMRMRRLGHGHTIMFFAPPGVDQSIRAVTGKQDLGTQITISDVLSWTIRETWEDIQHRAPYWAQQGIVHQSRYDAMSSFCNDELTPKQLSDVWLQSNSRSLVDLYAPRKSEGIQSDLSAILGMRQRCKDLNILSIHRGGLEEEQEREVYREREREREADLPLKAEPARHCLHPDVMAFVKTGVIPSPLSGSAFVPAFTTLELSTVPATHSADVWSPSVLATVDFSRTIKPESTKGTIDQYLRPVQWILSGKTDHGPVLVILSPFEADLLISDIRASKHVYLHLYVPRTSERVKPSDDLRLYSVPPLPSDWTPPSELIDQLNIFAGQLYLRDYESYLHLCHLLNVPMNQSSDKTKIRQNPVTSPVTFEQMKYTHSSSPLPMVMALLAIRNRGRPFDHTHMGKILQGQILAKEDLEGPKSCYRILPQPIAGSSSLSRSSKRRLETIENFPAEGPSQKRTRVDEGITMFPLPSDGVQDQPRSSRMVSKRVSEIADADQEPSRKRPHSADRQVTC